MEDVICLVPFPTSEGFHRPLTSKLCWCPFSSVPHVSDRQELHNNWSSGILHPGPSESGLALQWRNSGSPIEQSVAHGTFISAPRYASAWKQRKRHGVVRKSSNAHSVRKYKNGCTHAVSELKRISRFRCFSIPWFSSCSLERYLSHTPCVGEGE